MATIAIPSSPTTSPNLSPRKNPLDLTPSKSISLSPHARPFQPSFNNVNSETATDTTTGSQHQHARPQHVNTTEWQIPAVHSTPKRTMPASPSRPKSPLIIPPPPSSTTATAPPTTTSNKPVKIGRQQAWLKFMAYEACIQICLHALLHPDQQNSNKNAESAHFFLRNACYELQKALGIQQLMLPHRSSASHSEDIAIYWDDRVDDADGSSGNSIDSDHHHEQDVFAAGVSTSWHPSGTATTATESVFTTSKSRTHHQKQQSEASMNTDNVMQFKTVDDHVANADHTSDNTNNPSIEQVNSPLRDGYTASVAATSTTSQSKSKSTQAIHKAPYTGPAVHANVLRVVGCPILDECGTLHTDEDDDNDNDTTVDGNSSDNHADDKKSAARYAVLMRHPGDTTMYSLTRLTSTGGIKSNHPFIIPDSSSTIDEGKNNSTATTTTTTASQDKRKQPSHQNTVLVELVNCTTHERLATGTIQTAEILRISRQGKQSDTSTTDTSYSTATGVSSGSSSGFFRRIMGQSRRKQEKEQSIAWVRLVDSQGSEAGHVVLTAKMIGIGVASLLAGGSYAIVGDEVNPSSVKKDAVSSASSSMLTTRVDATAQQQSAGHHDNKQKTKTSSQQNNQNITTTINTTTTTALMKSPDKKMRNQPPPPQQQRHFSPVKRAVFLPSVFAQRDRHGIVNTSHGNTSGGFFHANAQHVYDILLEASLLAAGCNASCLVISGPWRWLLNAFMETYNVREQYATLSYLCWVVRKDNAAPTATCLGILHTSLMPILEYRDQMGLTSSELALLGHVLERCKEILTVCFENYFALNEEAQGGLSDGALSVRHTSYCPPALVPGVALAVLTRGKGHGTDSVEKWLSQCIHRAARKRFQALLAATESQHIVASEQFNSSSTIARTAAASTRTMSANMSYTIIEELCTCIMNELTTDASIQATGVFKNILSLPSITSVEYIRGIIVQLHKTLQVFPPPGPTPSAVRLVEAVGALQSFIEQHQYTDAASRLNSKDIFGTFVQEWVESTTASLLRALRALDRAGPPLLQNWPDLQGGPFKHRVSPLIEEMLTKIEAEMQRYQRIVNHWPLHALQLEQALVFILRQATSAVSQQCGLVQTKEDGMNAVPSVLPSAQTAFLSPKQQQQHDADQQQQQHSISNTVSMVGDVGNRKLTGGRVAWRWIQVGAISNAQDIPSALRRGMNPHQALLLNSLRRLLAVVPQLEHTLVSWCDHGVEENSSTATNTTHINTNTINTTSATALVNNNNNASAALMDLGAHWAQLVKELRTEYFACITLCAESLTNELSTSPNTSVIGILRREGLTATSDVVSKHVRKVLSHKAATLRWLGACLDGRVFIALGRGLWDLTARDILRYSEDLSEGGGISSAWRGRKNAGMALDILDGFFKAELAAVMGSDLFDRDLVAPQHAQRAAALLAENSLEVNASFEVY